MNVGSDDVGRRGLRILQRRAFAIRRRPARTGRHRQYALRVGGVRASPDERYCAILIANDALFFVVPSVNADQVRLHTSVALHTFQDEVGPSAALSAGLSA